MQVEILESKGPLRDDLMFFCGVSQIDGEWRVVFGSGKDRYREDRVYPNAEAAEERCMFLKKACEKLADGTADSVLKVFLSVIGEGN